MKNFILLYLHYQTYIIYNSELYKLKTLKTNFKINFMV